MEDTRIRNSKLQTPKNKLQGNIQKKSRSALQNTIKKPKSVYIKCSQYSKSYLNASNEHFNFSMKNTSKSLPAPNITEGIPLHLKLQ